MTKNRIDDLISISKEKNKLLGEMYNITKGQRDQIYKEDMDKLNKVLDKKDHIIKEINRLDASFLSLFSQIKKQEAVDNIDELDMDKYPNLIELKGAVGDISSTLMAISLIDEENAKAIKEKLEDTKLELRKVKEGKRAYKGYNATITESMLIDEKK